MPEPLLTALLADPVGHLDATDAAIRRLAVSLCTGRAGEPVVRDRLLTLLTADDDGAVRAAAAEALSGLVVAGVVDALLDATGDGDPRVVEAATTALGEGPAEARAVRRLVELATGAGADTMVREAAVASLGALGDPSTVGVLVGLSAEGPPQVRRRAVVALTVFEHPAVEPALRRATRDRNPMVREVAEMVVGRTGGGGATSDLP